MSRKRKRQRHSGCALDVRDGKLRLRYRWQHKQVARTTGLPDTRAARQRLEPLRKAVAALVRAGKDPSTFLEEVAHTPEKVGAPPEPVSVEKKVRDYYKEWIARQVPALTRKAQLRDYRRHMERYVLPRIGDSVLALLGPGAIRQLQADLLEQVKRKHGDNDGTATLSVRFAKNIVVGSFHSMILQAVEDGEIEYDPFPRLKWPRAARPEPDPFGPKDVPRIIAWFARARFGFHPGRGAATSERRRPHGPYFAYVHALFWTGLRPSEASGLEWRDVDLEKATADIRRSYHLGATGAPKTDSAHRTIELFPLTVEILRTIQPLRVTPTTPVFTTTTGTRIEPKTFSSHWYDCLRTLGVRMRGLYCTKDTFVTMALRVGAKIAWLENQTGVNYATLRRHYGKWMTTEDRTEQQKFAGVDASLFAEAGEQAESRAQDERRKFATVAPTLFEEPQEKGSDRYR